MPDDRCELLCLDLPKAEASPGGAAVPSGRRAHYAQGFRALGDPTRLMLAIALREAASSVSATSPGSAERAENLVSHHLRVLRAAGLADYRRDGKMALYTLTDAAASCSTHSPRRSRHEHQPSKLQRRLPGGPQPHARALVDELSEEGFIEYRDEEIQIINRPRLERIVCECYDRVRIEASKIRVKREMRRTVGHRQVRPFISHSLASLHSVPFSYREPALTTFLSHAHSRASQHAVSIDPFTPIFIVLDATPHCA